MNRRDALKTGAALAVAPAMLSAETQRSVAAAAWKPAVFDAHQNDTVVQLTELIIPATDTPGAKQALVNRYMDLFLKDGPTAERERFLAGLNWLDSYARKEAGSDFVKLNPAKQTAILTKLDAGDDPAIEQGHRFFRMLKAMTARIYYQTEIGYRELNKKGAPSGFGCRDTAHKG